MNKIEALNEKALEAARKAVKAAAVYDPVADVSTLADHAIRAYLTASDAEREPVSAAETTADTLQRFPKIMGALAKAEREPVAWPRIMYVCEYCQENNPEMCGHDRTDLHVTPDGRWLCDACLEDDGAPIADCSSPPLLYLDPPPTSELEAENARLREERSIARARALAERRAANEYAARLAEALKALDAIIERSNNDPLGTSKVNDMRRIAEDAARRVREGGKVE